MFLLLLLIIKYNEYYLYLYYNDENVFRYLEI